MAELLQDPQQYLYRWDKEHTDACVASDAPEMVLDKDGAAKEMTG